MDKSIEKLKSQKEPSFFQKFIYWFLIPLLFGLFLVLIIASINGVNIFEKTQQLSKKIPFAADIIKSGETEKIVEFEQTILDLEAQIHNKDAQLHELQSKIDSSAVEKERLLLEQERLEATIDELRQMRDENKRAFKEIVSTYEAMTPKSAAPIILKMKDEEAVKILSNISTEKLAKIMEKMPAESAAKYSEMLAAKTE